MSCPGSRVLTLFFVIGFFARGTYAAQTLILSDATVVSPSNATPRERKAVQMLVEEVAKRTGLNWQVINALPQSNATTILVCTAAQELEVAPWAPQGASFPAEGFRLVSATGAG